MHLKKLDVIIMIIVAMNILWALLPNRIPVVEIFLALPLVFLLPGYMLAGILFSKRPLKSLDRFILSLGLSMAIDVVGGLALHLLPVGLRALSWATLLGLVTIALSLLQACLRQGVRLSVVQPLKLRFTCYPLVSFVLAVTVILLIVLYSARSIAQQSHPGFTQIWMLPVAQNGKACAVHIGVRSFESTSVTYLTTIITGNVQRTSWPSFSLAPQAEWKQLVPITLRATRTIPVKMLLYRLDKPASVYRQVSITLYNCT